MTKTGKLSFEKILTIMYILFSLMFLLFNRRILPFSNIIFGISIITAFYYFYSNKQKLRIASPFIIITSVYALWIIIASIMHYYALNSLDPSSYITTKMNLPVWGISNVIGLTRLYLYFPLMLPAACIFMWTTHKPVNRLLLLQLIVIPSLIIAFYQGTFDINFYNSHSIKNVVSGMGSCSNGFGISLYLFFALAILSFLTFKKFWVKFLLGLFILALFYCLYLSGSRTGFLGVLIFIILLPWIYGYASLISSKKMRLFLILLPIIIIMSAGVISNFYSIKNPSQSKRLNNELIKTISDYNQGGIKNLLIKSGRYDLGLQAIRLIKTAPLSGWGPGGFFNNLDNIRYQHGEGKLLFDNVSNYYLQLSCDLGLAGGFLSIFLHIFPVWMIFSIRKKIINREERLALTIIAATVIIFMFLSLTGPHVFSLEVLWVLICMISYLFVSALRQGYSFKKINISYLLILFLILTFLFSFGTYTTTFGKEGYQAKEQVAWLPNKDISGFYPFEGFKDKSGKLLFISWTWTMKEAQVKLSAASDTLRLYIEASKINSSLPEGLKLNLFVNDQLLDSIHFINGGSKILSYYVPGIKNTDVVLKFQVNRTFNPYLLGISSDKRDLGVQILAEGNLETKDVLYNGLPLIDVNNIRVNKTAYIDQATGTIKSFYLNLFLNRLPLEGTGLYQKEKWDAGALPEGFNHNPAEVRWTGMRASIPISQRLKTQGGQVFLKVAHPDVQQNSVQVTVLADGRIVREENFSDHSWEKLSFIPGELADADVLTFKLDRTWNPKLSKVSEDTRDLGAALLLPE